jgi:hypothetical protein
MQCVLYFALDLGNFRRTIILYKISKYQILVFGYLKARLHNGISHVTGPTNFMM